MKALFHLAYHVTDLDAARRFYGSVLGCREGRSTETWVDFDFFGHQISLHLGEPFKTTDTGRVGGTLVPMPHLGLVLQRADWQLLADRLRAAGTDFVLEPQLRWHDPAVQRAAELKEFFAAQARDPKLRRQREAKELRQCFGIGFVGSEHYPRVMSLLWRVSSGDRLNVDDVVYLQTEAEDCWTEELQRAWHAIEAEALAREWERSHDPWNAINASSHWRKAAKPSSALGLIPNPGIWPEPLPRLP